jgi:hypothetical protein
MNRSTFTTAFVFSITKPGDPYAPRVMSHPIYQSNVEAARAELEKKFKPSLGYVVTPARTITR